MSFRVLDQKKLGRAGGFGELYVGRHSETGGTVVVKYLRKPDTRSARRMFEREVRILLMGLHPGLVRILGHNLEADPPFYVMEYLAAGSMTAWAGRLSAVQLRTVAITICDVVAAMHTRDVDHGDIKPDNILLSDRGVATLADPLGNGGGCTVLYDANHGGTPGYWAPEVAAGGHISKAGDVYSIGATLYHLATGRVPVDGQDLDPWKVNSGVEPQIRGVILACCRQAPSERPTIVHVQAMLRAPLRAPQIPASPVLSTNGAWGALAIAALVILVVLFAVCLYGLAKPDGVA